ncbi:porin [Mucilaginibacter myungsuensis]|uniref:Porin n=1 Tax=Mucilaginibacter myungsuensis TaxID=649104 RepID=A0A929KTY2_9SPHI|nr:porin [Mucilaginibacter myungsuensis]MBE9660370.1 porin [Mucilaginibacter myungsuensis]MDN3600412.1 porin [Mucilaginibacter myungsuensis]
MKSKLLLLLSLTAATFAANAQEKTDPPLTIGGSVDTYYKYDFSGHNNIPTSFASDQNSFSIGMVNLFAKKKVGKASFVGDLSFGPRGQYQSVPNGDGATNNAANSFHIQNLYVAYDLTDKLSVTAGYMATFVGYEVISPVGNFNYSTSYLFTNGPFQNAGAKFTYAFSDKVSLSAGLYNDLWNVYTAASKINTIGTQLMVAPVKGWTAYVNFLTGPASGTVVDLTTSYQITEAFKLGVNAANFDAPKSPAGPRGGYVGAALYPQLAVSSAVSFGLRAEYFKTKDGVWVTAGPAANESVTAFTLSANIKGGPLTFIPEVRLDNASKEATSIFTNKNGVATKSASQFGLAAVYAF